MRSDFVIDIQYMREQLLNLLAIPSPVGYTDAIVHYVGEELSRIGVPFELTRRGAIRAELKGTVSSPDRGIVAHLDTLGAFVKNLKDNGRLEILPLGNWSSRFAEGGRVTIFTDTHSKRGTVLPVKASGHAFNTEIDTLEVSWDSVEVRVDEMVHCKEDLLRLGFNVGDYIAFDSSPEVIETGYINARYLDDKAGVAALLAAAKKVVEEKIALPVDCHLLFTLAEEVGSGASSVLHQDVAEMVTVDMAPLAPGQNSSEFGVTVALHDSSGPFDYHLTHKLLGLCRDHSIVHTRDSFRYYRCDSASAIESGNDIRTALVCFGVDGSHGYERLHENSLLALSRLLVIYMQSPPTFHRDRNELGPLEGFPQQPD